MIAVSALLHIEHSAGCFCHAPSFAGRGHGHASVSATTRLTVLRLAKTKTFMLVCACARSQLSEGAAVVALQYLRDALKGAVAQLDEAGSDAESKLDVHDAPLERSEQERQLDSHIDVIVRSNRQIIDQHTAAVERLLESFA